MKFVTFSRGGQPLPGVVIDHPSSLRILDIGAAARRAGEAELPSRNLLDLIEGGNRALDAVRRIVERAASDEDLSFEIDTVRLHAPIEEPPQMRDFSVFSGHIRNAPAGMQRIAARKQGNEAAAKEVKPLEDVPQVYRDRPIYYITADRMKTSSGPTTAG